MRESYRKNLFARILLLKGSVSIQLDKGGVLSLDSKTSFRPMLNVELSQGQLSSGQHCSDYLSSGLLNSCQVSSNQLWRG